jgi:hypothetical protein
MSESAAGTGAAGVEVASDFQCRPLDKGCLGLMMKNARHSLVHLST